MKGKFVKVVSVNIDRDNSILNLTLECGHTLEQKRSKSFLDKEQFQTLLTPQGKPLKAHCNVCKVSRTSTGSPVQTVEVLHSLINSVITEYEKLLDALADEFRDATHSRDIDRLCEARRKAGIGQGFIKTQVQLIDEIKELVE